MSARDYLLSVACQDMPVTVAEVDEAIDAFAHELAEKQHAKAREYEATQTEDFIAGMQVAADLIDPMKGGDRG